MRRKKQKLEVRETPVDILLRAVEAQRRASGMPWPPIRNDGHSVSGVTADAAQDAD